MQLVASKRFLERNTPPNSSFMRRVGSRLHITSCFSSFFPGCGSRCFGTFAVTHIHFGLVSCYNSTFPRLDSFRHSVLVWGVFSECRWCESWRMSSDTFALETQCTHYVHVWPKLCWVVWPPGMECQAPHSRGRYTDGGCLEGIFGGKGHNLRGGVLRSSPTVESSVAGQTLLSNWLKHKKKKKDAELLNISAPSQFPCTLTSWCEWKTLSLVLRDFAMPYL